MHAGIHPIWAVLQGITRPLIESSAPRHDQVFRMGLKMAAGSALMTGAVHPTYFAPQEQQTPVCSRMITPADPAKSLVVAPVVAFRGIARIEGRLRGEEAAKGEAEEEAKE